MAAQRSKKPKAPPPRPKPDKPDVGAFYTELAAKSSRARLASEVEGFRSVPTIFPGFNRATTVGGAPLSCVWLVSGPSMGGKTVYLCGLIRSFQLAGGVSVFVDAELSADTRRWMPRLGVDLSKLIYIGRTADGDKKRPMTYEEVTNEVEKVLDLFQEMKAKGRIPPDTPLIIVVDSISKMVPEDLLKKIAGKEGGKALRGGVGRVQALLNTAWLAALGPRVGDDNILFAVIAHEMEDGDATKWTKGWKVRGGAALIYDSMMHVRVTFAGQTKDLSTDGATATGKCHRIKIHKNKHGPAFDEAYFYTASGEGICPMGFDRVREVLHEGILRGLVTGPSSPREMTVGSSVTYDGKVYRLKKLYEPESAGLIEDLADRLNSELLKESTLDTSA